MERRPTQFVPLQAQFQGVHCALDWVLIVLQEACVLTDSKLGSGIQCKIPQATPHPHKTHTCTLENPCSAVQRGLSPWTHDVHNTRCVNLCPHTLPPKKEKRKKNLPPNDSRDAATATKEYCWETPPLHSSPCTTTACPTLPLATHVLFQLVLIVYG